MMHAGGSAIPHPLKVEHDTFYYQLDRARTLPGRLGTAARALVEVMPPHMTAEETYALPPLALLQSLADDEVPAEAEAVIAIAARLRKELPTLHQEHQAIRTLLHELGEAARESENAEVGAFADAVMLHTEIEEQILYPAAVLVGELLRLKLRI